MIELCCALNNVLCLELSRSSLFSNPSIKEYFLLPYIALVLWLSIPINAFILSLPLFQFPLHSILGPKPLMLIFFNLIFSFKPDCCLSSCRAGERNRSSRKCDLIIIWKLSFSHTHSSEVSFVNSRPSWVEPWGEKKRWKKLMEKTSALLLPHWWMGNLLLANYHSIRHFIALPLIVIVRVRVQRKFWLIFWLAAGCATSFNTFLPSNTLITVMMQLYDVLARIFHVNKVDSTAPPSSHAIHSEKRR